MTPEGLRDLFVWNTDTGEIRWKHLYGKRRAFVSVQTQGYLYGKLNGKNLLAHRVLWALEHGAWPTEEIDHINQDKKDNRLCNLQQVSRVQNSRNKGLYKNNTSGFAGVSRTQRGNWCAYVVVDEKQLHLGVFNSAEEAREARASANDRFGFSSIHGTLV
jgi:hypothetical protein